MTLTGESETNRPSLPARLKTAAAVQVRLLQDRIVDGRFGGDTGAYIDSRLRHLGAFDCGTCHYTAMFKLFRNRIRPDDVLVDVGCGLGRAVNTWLWMGCKNRIVGLELDEEIAETVRKRLRPYRNVEIITGDATEHLPSDSTLFYIFNSFSEEVVRRFLSRLKAGASRLEAVRVLYYNPVYLQVFQADPDCRIEIQPISHSHFDLAIITFASPTA